MTMRTLALTSRAASATRRLNWSSFVTATSVLTVPARAGDSVAGRLASPIVLGMPSCSISSRLDASSGQIAATRQPADLRRRQTSTPSASRPPTMTSTFRSSKTPGASAAAILRPRSDACPEQAKTLLRGAILADDLGRYGGGAMRPHGFSAIYNCEVDTCPDRGAGLQRPVPKSLDSVEEPQNGSLP